MFKEVLDVSPLRVHFTSVSSTPFITAPYPFPPTHLSTAFSAHPYFLYLHRCYFLRYYRCSVILFSFPSFPEFHRVAPLVQTCSTSKFVYNHACFCVYVYLLDLSSTYEKKHVAFIFLNLAYFT
jgi:hypothetical protein